MPLSSDHKPSTPARSRRTTRAISRLPQGGHARWPKDVPLTSNLWRLVPILIKFETESKLGMAFETFQVDPCNTSLQTLKDLVRQVFLRSKAQGEDLGNILNRTMSDAKGEVVGIEIEWGEDQKGLARLRVHKDNVEAVLCLLGACSGDKFLVVVMN